MRLLARITVTTAAAAAAVLGVATPAFAAPSGTADSITATGSDFSWTCTINADNRAGGVWVAGRSWRDPANPSDPAVDTARVQVTGATPTAVTFTRDAAASTAYGARCLWFTAQTGGTQLGKTSTALYVTTGVDNRPPVAVLDDPGPVNEDTSVVLYADDSTDPDAGDTLHYTWSFGDGTPNASTAWSLVDHTWTEPGTYTVTVTVTDAAGLWDTDARQVTVAAVTPPEPATAYGSNFKGVYKADYGPVDVQRVFFTGAPQPFGAVYVEGDLAAPVHTVVSFKLSPQAVIAGTHDAAMRAWFASFPTDRRVDWTFIHEPEDQIAKGAFTAAQYRAATIHLLGLAGQEIPAGADAHYNLVLMAFSLAASANRDWYDYYPDDDTVRTNGSPYVDVLAWDIYFQGSQDDDRDPNLTLAQLLAQRDVFAVNAITGDPIAVAEFGYDYDPKRLATLQDAVATFDGKAVYFTYFDLHGSTGPHEMDDAASRSYWAGIIAA